MSLHPDAVQKWLATDYAHRRGIALLRSDSFLASIGEYGAHDASDHPDSNLQDRLTNAGFHKVSFRSLIGTADPEHLARILFRKSEEAELDPDEVLVAGWESMRAGLLYDMLMGSTPRPPKSCTWFGFTVILDPPFAAEQRISTIRGLGASFEIQDLIRKIELRSGNVIVDGVSHGYVPNFATITVRIDEVTVNGTRRDPE